MQKAIIVCLSKQKDEIINLLQLDDYSFEPLLSNEQLYLIGDIEEYQINLLINIIKLFIIKYSNNYIVMFCFYSHYLT